MIAKISVIKNIHMCETLLWETVKGSPPDLWGKKPLLLTVVLLWVPREGVINGLHKTNDMMTAFIVIMT